MSTLDGREGQDRPVRRRRASREEGEEDGGKEEKRNEAKESRRRTEGKGCEAIAPVW